MHFIFYQKYHNQLTFIYVLRNWPLVTYMSVQGHFKVKTHKNGHKNEWETVISYKFVPQMIFLFID